MTTPYKVCPRCRTAAPLAAVQCTRCGHAYRTRFTAPAAAASPPPAPAPPTASRPAPASTGRAKLNGLQFGCLAVFGLFGALLLLGTLVGGSSGQWRPWRHLDVPTRQFHSPYPWIEVVRHADGQHGYLVYALADQFPSDWPVGGLTRGQDLGIWHFVLADGSVEPDYEGVRQSNNWRVMSGPYGTDDPLKTLQYAVIADNEGPPDFDLTPAGQQTFASLRGR